jgi:hypothetical protein
LVLFNLYKRKRKKNFNYVEVIRTPNDKYQKFMTYRLVYNIFLYLKF